MGGRFPLTPDPSSVNHLSGILELTRLWPVEVECKRNISLSDAFMDEKLLTFLPSQSFGIQLKVMVRVFKEHGNSRSPVRLKIETESLSFKPHSIGVLAMLLHDKVSEIRV